ncbi:hypothetical protein FHS35_006797 [Streptomyces umbrinus]|nr:hypothetical protein [Streptomyces umbrinus]GHH39997.1 hypothetical protein GCM10018775_21460 [Streptomyces umbrinus]
MIEYTQVKDEQKARIGFRDNLLYATFAAMAAVIAATLQGPVRVGLLLLLPPVCLVLGWTYLVNDEKISAIGRYVSTELAPRLAAVTPRVRESADARGRLRRAFAEPSQAFGSTPAGAAAAPTSSAG